MPIRGALIGAIVRGGEAIFPVGDDGAREGRPRDRLHRASDAGRSSSALCEPPCAGARGARAGARSPSTSRRAGARRHAGQVPRPRGALPDRRRDRLLGAVLALPRRGRDRQRAGLSGSNGWPEAAGRIGVREGYLVVALVWLLAAAFAALPYPASPEARSWATRSTRTSRRCRASRPPARASSPTTTRSRVARALAPADAVARRHGDHRARARGAPAPARRRPPAARDGAARAGGRPALGADQGHGAAALGPLPRADRRADRGARRARLARASTRG